MSGLIARPGDTIVLPIAPGAQLSADDAARLRSQIEEELPGVKAFLFEGLGGSAFVYRPGDAG